MYLPSYVGILSGRIFAVIGFQSNKNIKSVGKVIVGMVYISEIVRTIADLPV